MKESFNHLHMFPMQVYNHHNGAQMERTGTRG
jgi:hypothetical protein